MSRVTSCRPGRARPPGRRRQPQAGRQWWDRPGCSQLPGRLL